jgi:cell division protein FtsW
MAYRDYGQAHYFIVRQLVWTIIGVGALLVMMRLDYRLWQGKTLTKVILFGVLGLLLGVLLFTQDRFGARRWVFRGSVQPSELCKLAIIIYIAAWLASRGEQLRRLSYGLIPFSIIIGVVTGLIVLQPDFSTAVLIALVAVTMFFVAGTDLWQLLLGMLAGGASLVLLISRAPYRLTRVTDFLSSLNDPASSGYHVQHSLMALGSGGIFGRGLGASREKLGALPASHTDSVFAVLGEELGLVGCLVVIGLFALLAYRGFRIAIEAPDSFGLVLATGITSWIIFQAFINVAVITSTMPFTGLPLPFISFGGSSLVTCMAGVGLLESIAREGRRAAIERDARYYLGRSDGGAHLPRSGRL